MEMKNKNKKIKKLKLPLNKMTGDEKNYTAVLLEDVNSNMKAFWEIISDNQNDIKILKEKSDATFEQLGFMTEKIGGMETRLDSIESLQTKTNKRLDSIESLQTTTNKRLDSIESLQTTTNKRLDSIESLQTTTNKRLDSIEFKLDDLISEISFIKEEILALKTSLSAKADKEKLEVLEFKIVRIEKYLKLAQ